MAVLFPFEVEIYRRAGIPVSYVGNPVVHDAVSVYSRDEACRQAQLDAQRPVVALLPGSRRSEIKRHLTIMLETARLLEQTIPGVQFILPVAPTLNRAFILQVAAGQLPESVHLSHNDSRDIMRAADVAFVASGTATLETALIGTPMIVIYIVNALNYAIMKRLIQIPDISLVNIVAQKRIVPEYLQHEAVPETMAADIASLMTDQPRRSGMLQDLAKVRLLMGDNRASERVAGLIRQLIPTR